jgi:deoxyadenosine/deoxycytidine kinase
VATEPLPIHHLAVDGPIGVGKTTLVEMLAERFEGVKILEDVTNPFLPSFYEDRPGAAFQTELYFLLSRYKQQQDIAQRELFDRFLVADYTFPKNRIFAYLNLSDDELMLFDKLYAMLEPQLTVPDLVLYLSADLDTCMHRIGKRKRDFEKGMSEDYMSELIDAYNHYYHYLRGARGRLRGPGSPALGADQGNALLRTARLSLAQSPEAGRFAESGDGGARRFDRRPRSRISWRRAPPAPREGIA